MNPVYYQPCCIDQLKSCTAQRCESLTYLPGPCDETLLRIGKVSGTASEVRNIGKKNPFRPRAKFRNAEKFIDRHQCVHKLANITIPAKCSAYFRRLSCGFPLHFVLCLELFSSSKPSVNLWRATGVYVYFV